MLSRTQPWLTPLLTLPVVAAAIFASAGPAPAGNHQPTTPTTSHCTPTCSCYHLHTGQAGLAQVFKASNNGVPGAPFFELPWSNCDELMALRFGE